MRLFLATELPEEERRRLHEYSRRREWFGSGEGFRPVRPENLHLTLKFLGEVPETRLPQIVDALNRVVLPGPISLQSEGVTFFPPRGAINVFVARLGGDLARLRELHRDIEAAIEPLGFARESRPYTPHVTLARAGRDRGANRAAGAVRERVAASPAAPGEPFTTESFVLFESRLKAGGPDYVPLARFGG